VRPSRCIATMLAHAGVIAAPVPSSSASSAAWWGANGGAASHERSHRRRLSGRSATGRLRPPSPYTLVSVPRSLLSASAPPQIARCSRTAMRPSARAPSLLTLPGTRARTPPATARQRGRVAERKEQIQKKKGDHCHTHYISVDRFVAMRTDAHLIGGTRRSFL
jgi:hypothetical protein